MTASAHPPPRPHSPEPGGSAPDANAPETGGAPGRAPAVEAVLPDGGRRTVVVGPEDVFQAPGPAPPLSAREQAEAEPAAVRAARQAFFGPIAMVLGVSSALMAAALLALALLLWLHPG